MTRTRFIGPLLAVAAVAAIAAPAIDAAPTCTVGWDGGGLDSSWHTAANWNTDTLPGSADHVCLDQPDGGTVVFSGTATVQSIQGAQTLQIAGGTLTVADATMDGTLNGLVQSGGGLAGAGTLRVSTFDWTGGDHSGSGLLRVDGATHIHGNVSMQFDRRLQTAGGQWSSGEIWARNRAQWLNTGTFSVTAEAGDMVFSNWDSTTPPTIHNTGTLIKDAGTGDTDIGWAIDNDGTVSATTGRLLFRGGGRDSTGLFESPGGELLLASGTFQMEDGSYAGLELAGPGRLNVSADRTFSGTDFKMSGGTIGDAGTLESTGLMELTGGSMDGTGLTRSTGTTKIAGNVSFQFDRRMQTHDGEWTSGELWSRNRVVWTITGTFDLRAEGQDAVFANWDSTTPPTIVNHGTLVRTAGSGDTDVHWAIENDGAVRADAGRLVFRGGGSAESSGSFASVAPGRSVLAGGTLVVGDGSYSGFEVSESGRLNVSENATYTGTDLWQSGGTIGGLGTLATSGTWSWTGGTQDGAGLTRSTGFTRIDGNVALEFDRRIQTHDGEWLSGEIWSRNRTRWLNTGTFDMRSQLGEAVFANWDSTARPLITNTGTIVRSAGSETTTVHFAIDNDGTVRTEAGRLRFTGGGGESTGSFASVEPGRTVLAGGTFTAGDGTHAGFEVTASGHFDVAAGAVYTGTNLWQSGGYIGGAGTLETTGDFSWTGGTMDGTGLTRSTGTTTIAGNVALEFDRRLQTKDGAWLSGEIWSRNRTTWTNTGTFDLRSEAGEAVFANWDGSPRPKLVNTGTLVKTSTAGSETSDDTTVHFALENDGTIRTEAGRLRFGGGGAGTSTGAFESLAPGRTQIVGGNAVVVGPGSSYAGLEVTASGRVDVAADVTFSGTDLFLSAGAIGGPGTVVSTGTFAWTGGAMDGTGLTRSTGFTRIDGNVALEFDRRLETNDGEWASGQIWARNRTSWKNTGSFDMRSETGDLVFGNWDGSATPRLHNTGTITRSDASPGADPAPEDLHVSWQVDNDGSISAQSGRILLTAGGYDVADGKFGAVLQSGTYRLGSSAGFLPGGAIHNAVIDLVETTDVDLTGVDMTGGVIDGAGDLRITSGETRWSGGSIRGSGIFHVGKDATLVLAGGTKTLMGRRLLQNEGTLRWDGGHLFIQEGATLLNEGLLEAVSETSQLSADGLQYIFQKGPMKASLINTGTILKAAGTGMTSLHGLENEGLVDIRAGRVYADDFRQTAGGRVLLTLAGTAAGTEHGVLQTAGNAKLAGRVAVQLAGGYTPAGGDRFTVVTLPYHSGEFGTLTADPLALPDGGSLDGAQDDAGNYTYSATVPAPPRPAAREEAAPEPGPAPTTVAAGPLVASDAVVRLLPGRSASVAVPRGTTVQVLTRTKRAKVRFDRKARRLRVQLRRGARGRQLKLRYRLVAADGRRSKITTLTVRIARRGAARAGA